MKIISNILALIVTLFLATSLISIPFTTLVINVPPWLIQYGKLCENFWLGVVVAIISVLIIEMCIVTFNLIKLLLIRK